MATAGSPATATPTRRTRRVETSRSAKFLLASSFDYKKTEKREHTGDGGGPVQVNFHEEVVETPWEPGEGDE